MTENHERPVFITSDGREIPLKRISQVRLEALRTSLLQRYIERGERMSPPTYTMQLAGGGTQEAEHDEESIKDERTTDVERAQWANYVDATARFDQEYKEKLSEMILLRGVDLRPTDDLWIQEQQEDGINVPEDPRERRIHWLWTEVFTDLLDIPRLVADVLKLSAKGVVPQEMIDAAEASFQAAVEDLKREVAERVADTGT